MKRLWQDIKQHRRLLLGGCALLLIIRWIYLRGLPERMFEVTSHIQAIRAGKVYMLRQDSKYADFLVFLADQHVERRIAREVLDNSQVAAMRMIVADSGIYYVIQPSGYSPSLPAMPGQMPLPNRAKVQFRFRRLPLEGGSPGDIPAPVGQLNPVIAGQTVYWLEPEAYSKKGYISANRLKAAPLKGGEAISLHRALPGNAQLTASRNGVYWITPSPNIPRLRSLCHMAWGDTNPMVISPYAAPDAPIELDGRLYWVEQSSRGRDASLELISARQDGTDRQSVYKRATFMLMDGSGPAERISQLIPHEGKLYFLAIRVQDRTMAGAAQPAQLYCVDSGTAKTAHEVHKFDSLFDRYVFIDGDYYYYTVMEVQDSNIFDFSEKGLFLKRQPVLYRYRLPG